MWAGNLQRGLTAHQSLFSWPQILKTNLFTLVGFFGATYVYKNLQNNRWYFLFFLNTKKCRHDHYSCILFQLRFPDNIQSWLSLWKTKKISKKIGFSWGWTQDFSVCVYAVMTELSRHVLGRVPTLDGGGVPTLNRGTCPRWGYLACTGGTDLWKVPPHSQGQGQSRYPPPPNGWKVGTPWPGPG